MACLLRQLQKLVRKACGVLLIGVAMAGTARAAASIQPDAVGLGGDVRVGEASLKKGSLTDEDLLGATYVASIKGDSPAAELQWLSRLTGLKGLAVVDRLEVKGDGCKSDCAFGSASGLAFGWFIVKAANDVVAFKNGGDLHAARFGGLKNGTSHVTFVTPLPAAAPLLLAGLAALAGARRLRRKGA